MSCVYGIWTLDEDIELKTMTDVVISAQVSNKSIDFLLPLVPDEWSFDPKNPVAAKLIEPENSPMNESDWGAIFTPNMMVVHRILCCLHDENETVQTIYRLFPKWKNKFNAMTLYYSGKFVTPGHFNSVQHIDLNKHDDGLTFFDTTNGNEPNEIPELSRRETISYYPIKDCNHGISFDELFKSFEVALSKYDIALPYELIISAYRSVINNDLRSSVLIASTAVEQSIVSNIKGRFYPSDKVGFENDFNKHRALGGKLRWMREKDMSFSSIDIEQDINNIRNPVAHDGVSPSFGMCIAGWAFANHIYNDLLHILQRMF